MRQNLLKRPPRKKKGKGRKKRTPAKQRQSMQVPQDVEFLDETDDAGLHWTEADFTYLTRAWRIVAQERFRNSIGKTKDRENAAHKIYQGLNGGNDFKHREAYKILEQEQRWANLRNDGLNHAGNAPRNIARRTSDNYSSGNSARSNNLSEDPDGPPTLNPDIQTMLDELRLEKRQAKEKKERKRAEANQQWQAKLDLEQAKEDRKIMDKDMSNFSGPVLQYSLQRQAEIMERLAKKGGPST
ncbi:hypothetical protein GIB67_029048 [Kingdonia uniflora]|uniref:No apical meristem-associated C-terminal domain-containing protein n=1 Tax=Kingdonia uniflora TaxID=39325 RepID=A0A7J7N6C6_9MAGN|nr:hypothetical protein GIB67_029048 [Kingdonia uniflora]